jgi:hypothetical protein
MKRFHKGFTGKLGHFKTDAYRTLRKTFLSSFLLTLTLTSSQQQLRQSKTIRTTSLSYPSLLPFIRQELTSLSYKNKNDLPNKNMGLYSKAATM